MVLINKKEIINLPALIELKNVNKRLNKSAAVLNSINLTLERGKIYGLFGKQNSGTSYLSQILGGLYPATDGEITFLGEKMDWHSLKNISYMASGSFLYDSMTINDMAAFFIKNYEDFSTDKYIGWTRFLRLNEDHRLENLSQNMYARAALSIILSRQVPFYVLDNPFRFIDKNSAVAIIKSMRRNMKIDSTIIIATDKVELLENFIDEAIYLHEGNLIMQTDAEKLKEQGLNYFDAYSQLTGMEREYTIEDKAPEIGKSNKSDKSKNKKKKKNKGGRR